MGLLRPVRTVARDLGQFRCVSVKNRLSVFMCVFPFCVFSMLVFVFTCVVCGKSGVVCCVLVGMDRGRVSKVRCVLCLVLLIVC